MLLIVVLSACAWTCVVSEEWPSSAEALRDAIVKLERCHFFSDQDAVVCRGNQGLLFLHKWVSDPICFFARALVPDLHLRAQVKYYLSSSDCSGVRLKYLSCTRQRSNAAWLFMLVASCMKDP